MEISGCNSQLRDYLKVFFGGKWYFTPQYNFSNISKISPLRPTPVVPQLINNSEAVWAYPIQRKWVGMSLSTIMHTPRLLIRSVKLEEYRTYGVVNDLHVDDRTLYDTIREWDARGSLQFSLILKNGQGPASLSVRDGSVNGFVQLLTEHNGYSELSFRTYPSARGKGFMKEALWTVFHYAFNSLHCRYLYVETGADNIAARALMDSFGLRGSRGSGWNVESVVYTFGREVLQGRTY